MATGLLLLTGGASRRLGEPKHLQAHPDGGTWASHLFSVFREALGPGPVRFLGPGLQEHPECPSIPDEGSGPALALAAWARGERERCRRWWIAPCDQVRWSAQSLREWHRAACAADPRGAAWVAAVAGGHPQPLGGFLGGELLGTLAQASDSRMLALWKRLPHVELPWTGDTFNDVDDPVEREAWLRGRIRGA
jgi:molybdopterin-guanine dinucleotide biosynthesis protein A